MKNKNSKETKNKNKQQKNKSNEVKINKKTKQRKIEETKKQNKEKKEKKKTIIKIILIALLGCILLGIIAITLFIMIIVKEAPDFDPKNLFTQESSIVYDGNGNEIAKLGTEKREKIEYDAMPQILVDAIVATEDSTFFQHNGFNAARFLKASLSQVVGGGGGGASTLTMQVSKNAYTSNVANGFEGIKRKFTDIYLSIFKIEKTYTKEEIMEFYVNSYYMGGGAYGVEQACQNYFGKSVNNINLAEAAMLAGIYQAPGYYDPTVNPENTEARRKTVLNLMLRHGYITEEEKEIAEKLTVDKIIHTKNTDGDDQVDPRYKDFIDTVVEDVKEKTGYNPYTTPMLIYTTMDNAKQEYVTNLMNGNNFNWENEKVQAGIAVIDTNTGAVVAIGAGRHRENQVGWNYATMNKRQIGSTSKPLYDYGPLIEYKDASTYHLFYDEHYSYSNGAPINNWDGGYKGLITAREALRISRNIPALKAFQENDNSNIYEFVTKLGLHPETEDGFVHEAHAIGAYGDGQTTGESPLTVAAAYAAFANGGYYTEPYTFTKIIYRNSDEEYIHNPEKVQVMSDATAYMVADMLVTGSGWVTGSSSINGITYGSKTGTSNYSDETMKAHRLPGDAVNDLWVAGTCRDYSTAIWYGYDEIHREFYNHGKGNIQLYQQLIKGIYTGTPNFTKPSSVVSVTVEKNSPGNGLLPSAYTPDGMKITELFKAGTEPTTVSGRFEQLPDVTNVKASLNGDKIHITWDGIGTPNALNRDYMRNLYANTCRNIEGCVNTIIDEDERILGQLNYQIYLKTKDGSLKLLHGTTNTSSDESIPQDVGNKATFVIKAAYTNYGSLSAGGVETSIDITNAVKKTISSSLKGNNKIETKTPYTETNPGVTVLENSKDVTSNASIKITVNDAQVNTVNLTTPGTYKIKYEIKYGDYTNTLTRTVIIQENSGN